MDALCSASTHIWMRFSGASTDLYEWMQFSSTSTHIYGCTFPVHPQIYGCAFPVHPQIYVCGCNFPVHPHTYMDALFQCIHMCLFWVFCIIFIVLSLFPYLYPVLIIWKVWWQASLLNQTGWICPLCRMLNDISFRLVCTWEENKAFNCTNTVKFVWSACPVFCAFVNGFGSFTGYFYVYI
jgi:hypothetical protein